MSYCTLYRMSSGYVITDGVNSGVVSNQAINMAREIARDIKGSVIVEDRGCELVYRVTPAGHVWRAPQWWGPPEWEREE